MKVIDKLFLFTTVLNADNQAMNFTVQFTNPTRRQLAKSDRPLKDEIAQRFRHHLRGIPYFCVLEFSEKRNKLLHVHGTLNPERRGRKTVLQLLRKIAGDVRKIPKDRPSKGFYYLKAVDYKPFDWRIDFKEFPGCFGPYGWLRYITKDFERTMTHLGITKAPVCVSDLVLRRAKRDFQYVADLARSISTDPEKSTRSKLDDDGIYWLDEDEI